LYSLWIFFYILGEDSFARILICYVLNKMFVMW